MDGASSRRTVRGQQPMYYSYTTVGLASDSSPFNDVSTSNKARQNQNPYANPSLGTRLPSHFSTVGLGCDSSPFNDAPSTINQTSGNHRLSPFYNNVQPYAHSTVWGTKPRTAQPIFSSAEGMKQQWKRQADYGDASQCHHHHCYTLICHCNHLPCPKRLRQEQANTNPNATQQGTSLEYSSAAIPDLSRAPCRDTGRKQPFTVTCQQHSKLSSSDATEIQQRLTEPARDSEVEKGTFKQSDLKDDRERMNSGNSSPNTSASIHGIVSPIKLQEKCSPVETKLSREIPNPIIPSKDIKISEETVEDSDSDCEIIYVGKVEKSQGRRQSAMRGNVHDQPSSNEKSKSNNAALFGKHLECQVSTWHNDQERTKPLDKLRRLLKEVPKTSLWIHRQKESDEALILKTDNSDSRQIQNEDTKQLSNDRSAVQSLCRAEIGHTTQPVPIKAMNATNTSADYIKRSPGDLSPEVLDEGNTIIRTPRNLRNQDKESPLSTSSAESIIPSDTVSTEGNLAENDWAGYGYDHSNLPRIVAVHTIQKDDEKDTNKKEVRGAKRLSSNEKKEWNRLLEDLTSGRPDGYHEVEQTMSASKAHGNSKLSGTRGNSDHCYSDPKNTIKISGLAEKQWSKKKSLASEHLQTETQTQHKTFSKYCQAHSELNVACSSPNQPASDTRKQEALLVKASVKIENDVDSYCADKNGRHEEEKWTMKELLPKEKGRASTEKPKTEYKEEVETIRRKIMEAEKKIEEEKIIWKKNILYRLKEILITRLTELKEMAS